MSTRPTLYIARQLVADHWDRRNDGQLAAIASIRIPWGRSRLTDPPAGHVATIKLLDTDRGYRRFENETMLGMRVEVRRTGDGLDVPLLLGAIAEHTARRVRVRDPRTGAYVDRVEWTISVSDTISMLSQRVRRGPYTGMQLYGTGGVPTRKVAGPWSAGGWPAQYPADRLAALSPFMSDLIPTYTAPPTTLPTPSSDPDYMSTAAATRPAVSGHHAHELPTIWDMIVGAYAASGPLAWPRVIPATRVEPGGPVTSGVRALKTGPDSTYPMVLGFGNSGMGSWRVGLDSLDVYPSGSLADRVATVTAPVERHEYRWQERLVDGSTGQEIRPDALLEPDESTTFEQTVNYGGNGSETFSLEHAGLTASQHIPRPPSSENAYLASSTAHAGAWNAAISLRNETADTLAALNDWLTLPQLTYRQWDGQSENSNLIQTWETGAIALQKSKYHVINRAPRTVQLIGGVLSWEPRGWHHVITPAPTIDTLPRDLTISQLFDVDNPINKFATNIWISDFAAFTERNSGI